MSALWCSRLWSPRFPSSCWAAVNVEAGQFGGYLREEESIFAYIFRSSGLTRSRLCYSYIHKLIHQRPGVSGRGVCHTVTGIGRAYTVGLQLRGCRSHRYFFEALTVTDGCWCGPKQPYNRIPYGNEGPSWALALTWPWHPKTQSQAIRLWLSWAMNFFFVIAKIYRFKNCVLSKFILSTLLQVSHNVQTNKINCYNTMLLRVFFFSWSCWW